MLSIFNEPSFSQLACSSLFGNSLQMSTSSPRASQLVLATTRKNALKLEAMMRILFFVFFHKCKIQFHG